jgi:hypothetical protein
MEDFEKDNIKHQNEQIHFFNSKMLNKREEFEN